MSWLICGTVPEEGERLDFGQLSLHEETLRLSGHEHSIVRGTPALMAAACIASKTIGGLAPYALLAQDTGTGKGSRALYEKLCSLLPTLALEGITFHYLLPDVDWQIKILASLDEMAVRPLLVADAGYMYAVKMSNCAPEFDLFTPDAGELAFLADEEAPHPFYTRGFLLADEGDTPKMVQRAVETGGAAKNMLVKGKTDHIVVQGKVVGTVTEPSLPPMEAIGGSGDTVTGIVSALLAHGLPMTQACRMAAKTNRLMGQKAQVTPATQIHELLMYLPTALQEIMQEEKYAQDAVKAPVKKPVQEPVEESD